MNDKPAHPHSPSTELKDFAGATPQPATPVLWEDAEREQAFGVWLARLAPEQDLLPDTLRPASSDAGFRRYLRIDTHVGVSRIIMDAPPALENSAPFVHVAALMHASGLQVPEILDWDDTNGFMLLTDLGQRTMLELIDPAQPEAARAYYVQALDALIEWQKASRPGVLPPYDAALLKRELQLFPDWYLTKHRGINVEGKFRQTLDTTFEMIVARNLAAPMVYVHRDFMPRNLMPPRPKPTPNAVGTLSAEDDDKMGVLDFQDAVYGPITYDIASLMRDAFLSWDEEYVLDITVRYWEKARKAGLMEFEDWSSDFGSFWRAVEWMGLQRHLKVAGIFARLSIRDGKPKYLADTPRFIAYIRHTASRYRELAPLLRLVDEVEGTQPNDGWAFGRM